MIRRVLGPALAACLLLSLTSTSRAADYVWNNPAGGQWATASNWTPGGVPTLSDNATVSAAGTYGIALTGAQAANNVTLNAAGATVAGDFAANFRLGGTLTLSAGDWRMGGMLDAPVTLTGGTVTQGTGGTGTFTIAGQVRAVDTLFQGQALRLPTQSQSQLRLAGSANFLPGSVVTFDTRPSVHGEYDGIIYESSQTLNTTTINLASNTTLGATGGSTLTVGAGSAVAFNDTTGFVGTAVFGRPVEAGNDQVISLVNRGTVRAIDSQLFVGKQFTYPSSPTLVRLTNSGLIEASAGLVTLNVTSGFANETGGVVRATQGARCSSTPPTGPTPAPSRWPTVATSTSAAPSRAPASGSWCAPAPMSSGFSPGAWTTPAARSP